MNASFFDQGVHVASSICTAIAVVAIGGCVSQGAPKTSIAQGQAIVIDYTRDDISSWSDMPMGTYRVPDSQVLVSGQQRGNAIAIAMGLPGAMDAATDTSGGKAAVQGSEETLRIPLTAKAQDDLARMLQTSAFSGKFTLVPNSNAPVLHVSSNIVLQFLENGNVIPFVILKGKLFAAHGAASTWTMRYAASIGGPRPLAGERGWMSEGGASLKKNVSSALERALLVMLTDVASPLPRDDDRKSAADGYFPVMSKRLQVVGYSITEDTDWIAFSPKIVGTSLLAGVNIMDKSVTKIRVATKDDRRISVSSERP
jgi:hypothetical protein